MNKKGNRCTVAPLPDLVACKRIKKLLLPRPKHSLLFVLAINSGLRLTDILQFRVRDLACLRVGDQHTFFESKTGKMNQLTMNKEISKAFARYIEAERPQPDDLLFESPQKKGCAWSLQHVNRMVQGWCADIGLQGQYGGRSLRKTWGTLQRREFGVDFSVIAERYNHSSAQVTRRYLGVSRDEVLNCQLNCI